MKRQTTHSRARAWYGGRNAPDSALLDLVEAGDTWQLYIQREGWATGDKIGQMQSLQEKLQRIDRIARWSSAQGLTAMVTAVVDYASDLRERALALDHLGRYAFDKAITDAKKKELLQAALAPAVIDPAEQARCLGAIWTPEPGGLLELIVNRPIQMGYVLAGRLDPAESPPLEVVGFSLEGVDAEVKQAFLRTRTAAYERAGSIYMLSPLLDALKGWDPPDHRDGVTKLTLWEMLFVHELTEMVLEETHELEPLPAHIVATTFERLLDDTLGMAVESYFLEIQRRVVEGGDPEPEGSIQALLAGDGDLPPVAESAGPSSDPLADLFDDSPTPAAPPSQTVDPQPQGNPDGKTVVVIDDTAMIRQLVGSAVVKAGHQFMEAADGKEGLTLIRTVHPDLVVLDLNMGEMGGLDTLRALRGDAEFKRMPIIVLTVESRQRIIREVLTWKIDDYLIKPVNMKKLQERLATHLGS